jgi:hypothetical protein
LFGVFIEWQKARDEFNRGKLWQALIEQGENEKLLNAMRSDV